MCELGNRSHMLTPEQQAKYRYYWEKLSFGKFAAVTFGMPILIFH